MRNIRHRSCCWPAVRPSKASRVRSFQPTANARSTNSLTEYDWNVDQVNHERFEELQKRGETQWSQDGYIIIDDSVNQKAGEELPGAGRFYDHTEGETVWGQSLVYAFYTDEKKPAIRLQFVSVRMPTTRRSMTLLGTSSQK